MTDHLDLEAIKERERTGILVTVRDLRLDLRALISEVERLRADVSEAKGAIECLLRENPTDGDWERAERVIAPGVE